MAQLPLKLKSSGIRGTRKAGTGKWRDRRSILRNLMVLVLVDEGVLVPGRLQFARGEVDRQVAESLRTMVKICRICPFTGGDQLLRVLQAFCPDIVFNLTQCACGDRLKDGHICSVLELEGIPYTGAGPRGLMLGRDKALSKHIAAQSGFRVPRFFVVASGRAAPPDDVNFPVIVKPRYADGSEGISRAAIVNSSQAIRNRVRALRDHGFSDIICEEFVEGREMTVGILGDRLLRPREILIGRRGPSAPRLLCERIKSDATYRRRWKVTSEFATLTARQRQTLTACSMKAAEALEVRDYGRLDVKLTPQNEWVFLEANPNPGLAKRGTTWHGTWNSEDWDAMIAEILLRAYQRGNCGA